MSRQSRVRRSANIPTARPCLTFPEAQDYLGIKSRKTLLKYIRMGYLPAFKMGGTRWRILKRDVERFLKQQRHGLPERH